MREKINEYFIIQPNFRNGGAERSAINNEPNLIITYGKLIDKNFVQNFKKIKVFENKFISFLLKLSFTKKLLVRPISSLLVIFGLYLYFLQYR